ncbi:ATP-dependent DNA helicase PIF6-like [Papaver somniferum]|uniref:ATP-dependent DNA helicase PIF6-like n=1 Tax=Papaver somniferum TaxID=3469 RepID=UPI000E6F6578|nr:ATP-dependent DNA helicase PIF6-like [Papaver somniferum]
MAYGDSRSFKINLHRRHHLRYAILFQTIMVYLINYCTFAGIASLLLPGGRTAHSRFKIPLKPNETSSCNVIKQQELAMLLKKTDLIIWDEAPMVHRHAFEAVNKTMINIMITDGNVANTPPFGGKTLVLGGDFRKILPVVTKGSREQIVDASISRSPLWEKFKIYELSRNMRLINTDADAVEQQKIKEFAKWVLDVGNGRIPAIAINESEEKSWIQIPDDLLIECEQDHLHKMVETMYSDLLANMHVHEYLKNRSILAPTNKSVKEINDHVLAMIRRYEYELLSADSIDPESYNYQEAVVFYPKEFLNEMEVSGLPSHNLFLKVGVPIMLLRNIDQAEDLCNGIRVVVKEVGKNVIQAVVVTGKDAGRTVLMPRIVMTLSETDHPFILRRRQYPLKVCFAMTVNKSQGQSLPNVGIYSDEPVLSHGQLYVAVSRTTSRQGLKIAIKKREGEPEGRMRNIVYQEIFNNLKYDQNIPYLTQDALTL